MDRILKYPSVSGSVFCRYGGSLNNYQHGGARLLVYV